MKTEKYYNDYPTRPIGGGNPYYCCASCGRSDPQINGKLENHNDGCKWVTQKQIQLSAESETETT
jgi:hypothetical protein